MKILMLLSWTPCLKIFLFLEWGQTHSLDMAAAKGPVLLALGGRCVNREHWRNGNWQVVPEYSEKNRSQCQFVHKNNKFTALESKPGLHCEKSWISHGRKPLIWTLGFLKTNLPLCSHCIYCILKKRMINTFPHMKLLSFKRNHFSGSRILMYLVVRTCIPPCNKHFTISLPARVPRRLR